MQLCFWVTFQILSGKAWKTWSTAAKHYSPAPWKTTTLPAVPAQTVDQNIGRPFEKCSPILALQLWYSMFLKFCLKILSKMQSNACKWSELGDVGHTSASALQSARPRAAWRPCPPRRSGPTRCRASRGCTRPDCVGSPFFICACVSMTRFCPSPPSPQSSLKSFCWVECGPIKGIQVCISCINTML
jgi:hypothetical protein